MAFCIGGFSELRAPRPPLQSIMQTRAQSGFSTFPQRQNVVSGDDSGMGKLTINARCRHIWFSDQKICGQRKYSFRSAAEKNHPDVCLRSGATSYIRLELTVYFPGNHIRRLAFLEFMPLKSGNTFLRLFPEIVEG
mgnify:CR=1 FL=1